ncbi:outer membrane protein [Luteibacter sp. NPDC031894]|uniref:outer membrane protein n=1 Tax=Luteibacter sp. NPDC031894 TaxID=3390572 RepID=UPI003D05F1E4
MQKLLLAAAVAAATSLTSFAAAASDAAPNGTSPSGAFIHFGMGKVRQSGDIRKYDNRKARNIDLLAGYRWGLSNNVALGVEGGLTGLGRGEQKRASSANGKPGAQTRFGNALWLLGANGKWNVTEEFSLIGRAGIAYSVAVFETREAGSKKWRNRETATRGTQYIGVGVGYALTNHLDLTLQGTRYATTTFKAKNGKKVSSGGSTINAGVEYRF